MVTKEFYDLNINDPILFGIKIKSCNSISLQSDIVGTRVEASLQVGQKLIQSGTLAPAGPEVPFLLHNHPFRISFGSCDGQTTAISICNFFNDGAN